MKIQLLASRDVPESLQVLVAAMEDKPDYARRAARLCVAMKDKLDNNTRNNFALAIRRLAPNDPIVLRLTGSVLSKAVPGWHFGCLDDTARNQAYQKALSALITPDTLVLDVGAGCGVLSLFAAKAGAKHVYAVEIEPLVAAAAREIVKLNGYKDRITVIEKDITQVKLGEEIPKRCDLVVQDIIWPNPFSRDIHNLLAHCKEHLLTPDAIFCPESLALIGVLSDADPQIAWPDYGDYYGFDLSPMTILASRTPSYSRQSEPAALVTDNFIIAKYDLREPALIVDRNWDMQVPIISAGKIHHMLNWLEFTFPDGTRLQNGPAEASVRNLSVARIFDPVSVKPGQVVTLRHEQEKGAVETTILA